MNNVFIKKEDLTENILTKSIANYFDKDLISIDEILKLMNDMNYELENLYEKIDELNQQITELKK